MKIAIGCDHAGFDLCAKIVEYFKDKGINYEYFGKSTKESVDYPDIARETCSRIQNGECQLGILVCGSGIGMAMAANKMRGIRAAVCSEVYSARLTRLHNNANVLCFGDRVIGAGTAIDMVEAFLASEFEGGRHALRVDKIMELESR